MLDPAAAEHAMWLSLAVAMIIAATAASLIYFARAWAISRSSMYLVINLLSLLGGAVAYFLSAESLTSFANWQLNRKRRPYDLSTFYVHAGFPIKFLPLIAMLLAWVALTAANRHRDTNTR